MSQEPGADLITVDLDRKEFRLWIRGVIEAFEEVPAAEFPQRIGQSWHDEQLLDRLQALDKGFRGDVVTVTLPRSSVQVIYRSLREAMAGQGEVEFDTRTGYDWAYAQPGLERLKQLAFPDLRANDPPSEA